MLVCSRECSQQRTKLEIKEQMLNGRPGYKTPFSGGGSLGRSGGGSWVQGFVVVRRRGEKMGGMKAKSSKPINSRRGKQQGGARPRIKRHVTTLAANHVVGDG